MKKITAIILCLILCLTFAACKDDNSSNSGDKTVTVAEKVIRSDNQGLVYLSIENGEATVTFNADKWADYLDRYNATPYDGLLSKAYPVKELSGKVKDACIVQIESFGYSEVEGLVIPTIFLLMEDGTVEQVSADVAGEPGKDAELKSKGALPWIKDIVSLKSENDTEGVGALTVFGTDSTGVRYNLRIPAELRALYSENVWFAEIYDGINYKNQGYYSILYFSKEGNVIYKRGRVKQAEIETFEGTYSLSLAEDDETRPGLLTLDMTGKDGAAEKKIQAKFLADFSSPFRFELMLSEGDLLLDKDNKINENITFERGDSPFYNDENLGDYLCAVSPEIKGLVNNGMIFFAEADYPVIEGEVCRSIWLGTDGPDQFVKEILYAVSITGRVYENDMVYDVWKPLT